MTATTGRTQEQQDSAFMELALRQAEAAVSAGQTPFGAVVVDQHGSVVGEGHNRVRADLDPDFVRSRALQMIEAFPWAKAQARTDVDRDKMR